MKNNTNYVIGGIRGFNLNTYMKAIKVRYGTWEEFLRTNQANWEIDPHKDLIEEAWDEIVPLTVQEAFKEENQEMRRALFSYLGPARIFGEMKPQLIDREVLKINNRTWDEHNNPVDVPIEDVYELYQIEEAKLFPPDRPFLSGSNRVNMIKVVRCWCTTTGREYWIFVEDQWWATNQITRAVQAVAWTFRVGINKPDIQEIYRQGDCLVIKAKDGATPLDEEHWYHLDELTYREKLVAQS